MMDGICPQENRFPFGKRLERMLNERILHIWSIFEFLKDAFNKYQENKMYNLRVYFASGFFKSCFCNRRFCFEFRASEEKQ